jgi:hypothetical protein
VPETVEALHLLLRVPTNRIARGEVRDELLDARPDLVGEVRCRRPDEGVDVVACRLAGQRAAA